MILKENLLIIINKIEMILENCRKINYLTWETTHDKRGISADKLSEDIDVTYKTAWLMLHKIRQAMRKRDADCMLGGIVELDDAFFGAPSEGG